MFKEYFDKVVLLNLAENKNRKDFMFQQFKEFGCEDEITMHTATLHPHCDIIINAFNALGKGKFTRPNEFNCSREHYSIVKQAYLEGCNTLLVIEDDVCFLKDKDKIIEYLNHIPNDYDILRMSCVTPYKETVNLLKNNKDYWLIHDDTPMWATAMYALNRRGMKYYIMCQDQYYQVADMPLYLTGTNKKIVKSYLSRIPLGIQEDVKILESDIRYKNQHMSGLPNYYEHFIKRVNYFTLNENK